MATPNLSSVYSRFGRMKSVGEEGSNVNMQLRRYTQPKTFFLNETVGLVQHTHLKKSPMWEAFFQPVRNTSYFPSAPIRTASSLVGTRLQAGIDSSKAITKVKTASERINEVIPQVIAHAREESFSPVLPEIATLQDSAPMRNEWEGIRVLAGSIRRELRRILGMKAAHRAVHLVPLLQRTAELEARIRACEAAWIAAEVAARSGRADAHDMDDLSALTTGVHVRAPEIPADIGAFRALIRAVVGVAGCDPDATPTSPMVGGMTAAARDRLAASPSGSLLRDFILPPEMEDVSPRQSSLRAHVLSSGRAPLRQDSPLVARALTDARERRQAALEQTTRLALDNQWRQFIRANGSTLYHLPEHERNKFPFADEVLQHGINGIPGPLMRRFSRMPHFRPVGGKEYLGRGGMPGQNWYNRFRVPKESKMRGST